uniref:Uncharacterized protein n=1 Tax=Anguilla anguilla TaxID=7936 RepID=A0A0E9TE36_ANGAN
MIVPIQNKRAGTDEETIIIDPAKKEIK